jgi:hypothetical protein
MTVLYLNVQLYQAKKGQEAIIGGWNVVILDTYRCYISKRHRAPPILFASLGSDAMNASHTLVAVYNWC